MALVMPSERTAVPRAMPQPTIPALATLTDQNWLTSANALASVTETESPNTMDDTGAGAAVVGGGAAPGLTAGCDDGVRACEAARARASAATDAVGVDSRATGSSTVTASAPVTTTAMPRYHDRGARVGPLRSSTGRSITIQLTAVANATDARRTPSSSAPERPVRAWSSTMNSGQCHRYTP